MTEPLQRPRIAVVLAAGKGTRMRSALPKVLHEAAGRPLLAWVVDAARAAGCARILIVVGHGAEQVRETIQGDDIAWVLQAEQRGTGHALAQAEAHVTGAANLLVLSGDVPLVTPATLDRLATEADAVVGLDHDVPAVAERFADQLANVGLVIDDRHFHCAGHWDLFILLLPVCCPGSATASRRPPRPHPRSAVRPPVV